MAFQQVQLVSVENGYVVGISKLEFTDQGYKPVNTQHIAENLEKALELIKNA